MKQTIITTKDYMYTYTNFGFLAIDTLDNKELFVSQNYYNEFGDAIDITDYKKVIEYFKESGIL